MTVFQPPLRHKGDATLSWLGKVNHDTSSEPFTDVHTTYFGSDSRLRLILGCLRTELSL